MKLRRPQLTTRPIPFFVLALTLVLVPTLSFAGGAREARASTTPVAAGVPATVRVADGEHFTHKLRIMPLIRVRNAPQMALWCETADGEFLTTLFVTDRIATQSWRGAPGDPTPTTEIRRPESLPVWAHRRGRVYSDGLRVPTRSEPVADAVTGATPNGGFTLTTELPDTHDVIVVYFEVNHSADFNDAFPADAGKNAREYSGGPWGSGQPALVYRAVVDLAGGPKIAGRPTAFELVGHASPNGSTGEIYPDVSRVTTAHDIVQTVEITVATPIR
jgi:hypothetical protein